MLEDLTVNLVDSVSEAERFLSWLGERRPHLAVDTETTGVGWSDTVRLVQFGDGQGGWAVPIRDWRGVAVEALSQIDGQVIMHNSQFDMHKLTNDGFPAPSWSQIEDTMVLARLRDSNLPAGLKPLCAREFGREAVVGQDLLAEQMRKNRWTWATVPDDLPAYWQYGVLDTCLTALAFDRLRGDVPAEVYDREMAVVDVMYHAEERGMLVDMDYTSALLAEWQVEADVLREKIQQHGIENPSSDHQVTLALKAAGWEPDEFTETGLPKLDKAVIAALPERFRAFGDDLVRFRRLVKWSSTYLSRFLRDGPTLHPDIQTLAARTGRMSIRNPALQTLPSKEASIRNCITPRKGNVLYAIDYSQVEMRMMAHFSGDTNLLAAGQRGEDLHSYCARLAYNTDNPTTLQYKTAKNTNFARLYGAGPAKIAATAGVPESDIAGYISAFDSRFPGVSTFMQQVQNEVKRRVATKGEAYITTSGGRTVKGDVDKVYAMVNYVCQGSAADLFKSAIVALDSCGLGDYIVCPVHDELLFEFPKDGAEVLAEEAKLAMEDHTNYAVPMTCEVTGPLVRWGDAYA